MSTITYHPAAAKGSSYKISFFGTFIQWCEAQEKNRLMWVGIALGFQGCVLLPFSMLAALLANTNPVLLLMAIASIVMTVITNLAAMPAKITIPVFFLGIVMDIAVIVSAAMIGMNFSRLFS